MPTIVIQHPLLPSEREALQKEFPYFSFAEQKTDDMEVFFGSTLEKEELEEAPLLRWIHLPTPSIRKVPATEIQKRGNILVTFTPQSGTDNHGQWAIASALSFVRGLYNQAAPLSLEGLTWLELFLEGKRARSNVNWARKLGLKVLGLQKSASFTPNTDRTFPFHEWEKHLPHADIVSLTTDPRSPDMIYLQKEELASIKKGAILLLSTSPKRVDWPLLNLLIQSHHFRGVAIDTPSHVPLDPHPTLLVTNHTSLLPEPAIDPAFPLFRHLLRDYLHENFVDMSPRLDD